MNYFDWNDYIQNYPDLQAAGIKTQQQAINHWKRHGRNENRIVKFNIFFLTGIKIINNHMYRFGNLLFFTYIISYIAKINNLPIKYERYKTINKLGIPLYTTGSSIYNDTYTINNNTVNFIFENPDLFKNKNVILNDFLQTPVTAKYIKSLINENKENIIKINPFDYNNNNVFVHIRLGDITNNFSHPFEYYDKSLSNLKFDKGYISSDTISHNICKKLIEKYNLTIFNSNEVETIQFGSSCKHIVLSTGTFSWYIGAFSFESDVYYPEIKKVWHGDIFVFSEWKKII